MDEGGVCLLICLCLCALNGRISQGVERAEKLALRLEIKEADAKVSALQTKLEEAEAEADAVAAALGEPRLVETATHRSYVV